MYSLSSPWFFKKEIDSNIKSEILSDFVGVLNKSVVDRMRNINCPISPIYFKLMELRAKKGVIKRRKVDWLEPFRKENYINVDAFLRSKL